MTLRDTLTEYEGRMILAYANHDMNSAATAGALYMCRRNLTYHFAKVQKKTGKNPQNFYDLHDLVEMVRGDANEQAKQTKES